MVRHKFANQFISLIDFNIQYSFVVYAFALDHFSVMDTDSEENCVHYLANDELQDLVIKVTRQESNSNNPCAHIQAVCHQKVPQ